MLQENGGGQGVEIAAPAANRPAHFVNDTQRGRRCVPLIDERHRQARPSFELRRDAPHLLAPRCLVTGIIEGEAHDERRCFMRLGLPYELCNWRSLAGAA
jgi:hypothetical protein